MTFSIASEIILPTSASPPADTVATWAIASPSTGLATVSISLTNWLIVFSIPLRTATGFAPAATFLRPSLIIDWAKTVAVVVPSPAISLVLDATSWINLAPVFSRGSSSSMSLATVIPSLTIWGAPNFFSNKTFLPFGPIVILTASARVFIPRSRERLDLSSNSTILAMYFLLITSK